MRTLILVRHGQYDERTGRLTALGRRQAASTAKALRGLEVAAIHVSTLPRAIETAAILKSGLKSQQRLRKAHLLREAVPTQLSGRTSPERLLVIRANLRRMKRAYAKLFRPHRLGRGRTELVVAHGNLIRLFVCLALRVSPTTWLKMLSTNCGITILTVGDRGQGNLVSFNDTGHLPPRLKTQK